MPTALKYANGLAWALILIAASAQAQDAAEWRDVNLASPDKRAAVVKRLNDESAARRESAWKIAAAAGWAPQGKGYALQAIRNNRVYAYHTVNANAAISTAANLIRNTSPYLVNGTGRTLAVWDGGWIRTTHQELKGRITIRDSDPNATIEDHATHVAGTIGATGVVTSARGMAPCIRIDSYEWNNDSSEMAGRGMATPGESGKIQLSNHSYSYIAGWYWTGSTYYWYGVWGQREDAGFGQYDSSASEWDGLCYSAPYYLPCVAASNDRDENAPPTGTRFYYYIGTTRYSTKYNPSIHPYNDGYDNGGFDTIPYTSVAKNILTVGAVLDAVSGGVRSLPSAAMTTFSSWGPTDDGRVKPDVVGNGYQLYSSVATSDSIYGTYNGTSMATPNVCGTAALLTEYYGSVFTGQYMRASTIKGLIIHTADDLGNAGPDYKFGWGLVNAKAAADLIKSHADLPSAQQMTETNLTAATLCRTNSFFWDGVHPIRATLCWTDPAGTAQTGLDNTTRVLVNDLDLRLITPSGQEYFPYVLNPAAPSVVATTGDNNLDNVEQVYIAAPNTSGVYRAVVSLHGALTGSQQSYSLILSGSTSATYVVVSFDSQGGSSPVPATTNVIYGAAYGPLAATTRTGYTFDGWWTDAGGTGSEITASTTVTSAGSQTLYAKWSLMVTSHETPYLWLDLHQLVTGGQYEAADLGDSDGDGHVAWQEYVAGSIPTNKESVLRSLIVISNGQPWISWVPDLGTARVYTVDGRTNLTDLGWGPTNSGTRFFRTRVRFP